MSHVAELELEVNDLDSLRKAAKTLGLEMVEKKSYKWFGRSVGDYPLPKGVKAADLGKCDYALTIPGNNKAYEVGVVKKPGNRGYTLLWDFWSGGFGLQEKIGEGGGLLKQSYAVERAKKEMLRKGFRVKSKTDSNGAVLLTFTE